MAIGFLALLDDIATLLDDVSLMTKVAAQKTAGVLGDDLALNAEQVSGVNAQRELPVVWAVAKGSFLNKLILVPLALIISAIAPWLVTLLLMAGGLYLCFEGMEKIAHKWLHPQQQDDEHHQALSSALNDPQLDINAFEQAKIKGAIRTDFVLSAEIIVIALGTVQGSDILTQCLVVSLIAVVMTAGVYGLVAAIVKFDDAGLALIKSAGPTAYGQFKAALGRKILWMAPKFMHLLSFVGMIAMFLVGGGILVHGLPFMHHVTEVMHQFGSVLASLLPLLFNAFIGLVAGGLALLVMLLIERLFHPDKAV